MPSQRLTAATSTKLRLTSRAHDPHLPTCTSCQKAAWSGYCQAPNQVAPFSATHRKNPISTNDRLSGIAYRRAPTVKETRLRHSTTTKPSATSHRRSGR